MTPYQVTWLEGAAGSRTVPGRWTRLVAPIITAILVTALGLVVFGLMTAAGSVDGRSRPAGAESVQR